MTDRASLPAFSVLRGRKSESARPFNVAAAAHEDAFLSAESRGTPEGWPGSFWLLGAVEGLLSDVGVDVVRRRIDFLAEEQVRLAPKLKALGFAREELAAEREELANSPAKGEKKDIQRMKELNEIMENLAEEERVILGIAGEIRALRFLADRASGEKTTT
jgi:hypothetical protein